MPNGPDYDREDKLVEALIVVMLTLTERDAERARARGIAPRAPGM